jgi:integrase
MSTSIAVPADWCGVGFWPSFVTDRPGASRSPGRAVGASIAGAGTALAPWIAGRAGGHGLFLPEPRAYRGASLRPAVRGHRQALGLIGADPAAYGTHSLRRTKATLIYRRTHNLRAAQLLLAHRKLESTVRYLGIEVDDALEMAERTEC